MSTAREILKEQFLTTFLDHLESILEIDDMISGRDSTKMTPAREEVARAIARSAGDRLGRIVKDD